MSKLNQLIPNNNDIGSMPNLHRISVHTVN